MTKEITAQDLKTENFIKEYISRKRVMLILGLFLVGCLMVSQVHAESEIKLWRSQTVYVPIYSHIFLGGLEKRPLELSANLIIRNTDSSNSIRITAVDYYDSEGKLIKKYLNGPKKLNPMASSYFLIRTSDRSGGWGANFIVEWEAALKVTEPVVEAVFTGAIGTHSYSFISPGKAIKGIYK